VKDDRPYLADIVQALHRVDEVRRRGAEAFRGDWVLQDAAIRNFEIVGEAVKRVSPALQAAHPEIPWADLAGFRDVLIHQYFRVDLEIVWALMERRVGQLHDDVARLVTALDAAG
jgi:uncharacterized protein with HEPN domain